MDEELRSLLDLALADIDAQVDRYAHDGDAVAFGAAMAAVLATIHLATAQAGATSAGAVLPREAAAAAATQAGAAPAAAQQSARQVAQRVAERELAKQLGYLQAWAEALEQAGTSAGVSEAQVRARARLYAGAIKATWSAAKYAGLPLPFHPGLGSECMVNCLCSWDVRALDAEAGDYDAYWRLGAAEEHCATCPAREAANPYQIRGGALL